MDTVKLKNGAEEATALVATIIMSLKSLMAEKPIVLNELVMLCRNRDHELFGIAGQYLRERNLIEQDNQPHDSIRNIVLSATEGEDMDLHLVSPVQRPEPPYPGKATTDNA